MKGTGHWLSLSSILCALGCAGESPLDGNPQVAGHAEDDAAAVPDSGTDDPQDQLPAPVPGSWNTANGPCGLSLTGPGLIAFSRRGVDSCVGGFESGTCAYEADLGGFSDPLSSGRYPDGQFAIQDVLVEGKSARLLRSRGRDAQNDYFVALHVASIWGSSSSVGVTITARCGAPSAQDEAHLVLQTLRLPANEEAAAAPLRPSVGCTGYDERPIEGYALGNGCAAEKVVVPSVCATGAETNNATGTGKMICFVTSEGAFYWGFVMWGEHIVSAGTRNGGGEPWSSELTPYESERCAMLAEALDTAPGASKQFGQLIAAPCP